MGGFRRIYMTGLAATVGLLLCGAASAQATDITASPECCTFGAGPFVQAQGETSNFANLGDPLTGFHNVTATAAGPDRQPLFVSETVSGGTTTPIAGTQYLTTGTYPFVCTLHTGMSGTLEVTAAGTPVERPALPSTPTAIPGVKLTVLAQKLKQVRKSGKLKIKVTPLAPSTGVKIVVKKDNKQIGTAPPLDLAATPKTISVKLSNAGRKAIKKGKKIQFSVTAKVPSGDPAKTSRTLR